MASVMMATKAPARRAWNIRKPKMMKKSVGIPSARISPTSVCQKGSQTVGSSSSSLVSMKLGIGSYSGSWYCICMVAPMP